MFSQYVLALGLVATGSLLAAGPCHIYSSDNTPCIAAHSTTRALYSAYSGSLYQVKRASNGATSDIAPLSAGGSLSTFYNDARPNGYNPMRKEGSIILCIGGDNSHGAVGTFYEGVMTTGYPSDATEN